MRLLGLYTLFEAGIAHPTNGLRKKKFFKPSNRYAGKASQDPERMERDLFMQGPVHDPDFEDGDFSDEDDLGPDMDYDDPSPPEKDEPDLPTRRGDPVRPPKPFKEPTGSAPIFGKPTKPSKALQGGKTAGTLKVDRLTLGKLEQALENVRTGDEDLQSWIDDVLSEIGRAIRSGGELTLPKFVAASDDDVGDDGSGDEDE